MVTTREILFWTGGALLPGYSHYVRRSADCSATRYFHIGKMIYVVAPRQMGKTSLLKRLGAEFQNHGYRSCYVDFAAIQNLDKNRWFRYLYDRIARACGIAYDSQEERGQEYLDTFLLHDVGLANSASLTRLVLLFDEIEGLSDLCFSNQFLMAVRCLYQQREDYFSTRLLFAFAGAVNPDTLVSDPTISPFNVAEKITLSDFTAEESRFLTLGLGNLGVPMDNDVHDRIYYWTAGHPYLTQRICEIVEEQVQIGNLTCVSADAIDSVIRAVFLSRSTPDGNVEHVRGEVARLVAPAFNLWQRVWAGTGVRSTARGFYALYLTGAVAEHADGLVKVRNRIYQESLSQIEPATLPDFRPDLTALRSHLSQSFDDAQLDALCLDNFPEVYDSFGHGFGKVEKMNQLLDYCRRNQEQYRKLRSLLEQL